MFIYIFTYIYIYIYIYTYIHIYIYIVGCVSHDWYPSISIGFIAMSFRQARHQRCCKASSNVTTEGCWEDQLGQPKMGNLGDSAGSTNNTSWPVTNPRIHYRMIECAFFGRLEVCCKRLFKSPSTYMSINYSM